MSPQPVLVGPGDTVTWSAYAIGVPPLAYQWLKNGAPVAGATASSLMIPNVSGPNLGTYALQVTNLYGSATSSVVSVDQITSAKGHNFVIDSNPKGPEHDGANFGATWLASYTDSLGKNRTGVMSFNGADPDQITVPASTNFNSTTGTLMFWMLSDGNTNDAFAEMVFDRTNGANGLQVQLLYTGELLVQAQDSLNSSVSALDFVTIGMVADTNWHHVALVYDQSASGSMTCYIDGAVDPAAPPIPNSSPWVWPATQQIELGLGHDTNSSVPYTGLLDDVRIYSRELTATEVASVYSSNALVDTNTLVLQLNFTTAPSAGVTLTWQETDVILQSAPTINGPWTDVGAVGSTVFRAATSKTEQFFRYRGHQPITIVSNPYLM